MFVKKRLLALLLPLYLLFLNIVPVSAASSYINKMDIQCVIDEKGNATMTETWDMEANQGTEAYKVFNNMYGKSITLLDVKENDKEFTNIGSWNVNASKSYKTNKCGLVKDGTHYEICFGIGNYGHHVFTFRYVVSHFINQYEEVQGIDYKFMSDMSLRVNSVTVDVSAPTPIKDENADIWAFGYDGDVNFSEDGHIKMTSSSAVTNKVQLLSRLTEATYSEPDDTFKRYKFEDILNQARNGSSYTQDNDSSDSYKNKSMFSGFPIWLTIGGIILSVLFTCIPFIIVFVILFTVFKAMGKATEGISVPGDSRMSFSDGSVLDKKNIPMFHDLPTKDLQYFIYLAYKSGLIRIDDNANIMTAYLLKWIKEGKVAYQQGEPKQGFFKKHDTYFIDFTHELMTSSPVENKLYTMFRHASGANRILETKEFENYGKRKYEEIHSWFKSLDYTTEAALRKQGYIKSHKTKRKVLFLTLTDTELIVSPEVKKDMEKVVGFYNFLKDEDNMAEKKVIEVKLWEEYLIYANVLGIADKVKKQLDIILPNPEVLNNYDMTYATTHVFMDSAIRAASSAYSSAHSSSSSSSSWSGGGGSSSSSGGGSFSSGGGGGGLR